MLEYISCASSKLFLLLFLFIKYDMIEKRVFSIDRANRKYTTAGHPRKRVVCAHRSVALTATGRS